jgi:Membrane-associated phospholipid phosphatase
MPARRAPDLPGIVRGEARELRELAGRQWRRMLLLFAGVLLPLWGFLDLAARVQGDGLLPFDVPVLRFAEGLSGAGPDRLFLFFSALGYGYGVVPFDIALVAGLALAKRFRESVFAAVALGGSALLNIAAKHLVARQRPALWQSIAPEPTWSFPSGHAMGSMTLAVVLVLLAWPTRLRWWVFAAMAVFVPMVGFSRVYLGVHYPSDILAGWTAACAWGVGAYLVAMRGRIPRTG